MTKIIQIVFFAIGTFFGTENNYIAAHKTTVSIDRQAKTMVIVQEDLFSTIKTETDSLNLSKALSRLVQHSDDWRPELKNFTPKNYKLYQAEDGLLNAKMTLKYIDSADLKVFDIEINKKGDFVMKNNPKWNLSSEDGQLNDEHWVFDSNKKITFTLEPFNNIPNKYKIYTKSLQPIWEKIKE